MTALADTLHTQPPSLPGEEWRPVPEYEDAYMVSSLGRVWSRPRFKARGGLLSPRLSGGYPAITLSRRSRYRTTHVHRLVMAAFVGPLPEGMQTRHLDGNPENNRLDNLAYGTVSENMRDRLRHGTDPQANKTHCPQGHRLSGDNLLPTKLRQGIRQCLTCTRTRWRAANRRRAGLRAACPACGKEVLASNLARHRRTHARPMGDLP